MKLMFASDFHGSAYYCKKTIDIFKEESAERLILLGDILYHGPRNPLPKDYDPKEVAQMLNDIKEKLLCVQGNCDSAVDQMVLEFPILAEYATIYEKGKVFFLTHGHKYNIETPPLLNKGDILIHGHTHVPTVYDTKSFIYINPGSVSLPKENSDNSYMIYEDGCFTIKSLDGKIINKYSI